MINSITNNKKYDDVDVDIDDLMLCNCNLCWTFTKIISILSNNTTKSFSKFVLFIIMFALTIIIFIKY